MVPGPPFNTVFFDCDSTLSAVEGIDELARRASIAQELIPMTEAAMAGREPLEAVYARRLDVIRPDRDAVDWLGAQYVKTLVDGSHEVVNALQSLGKQVHIVSGGIYQAVISVGRALGVPGERVHAVAVRFDENGAYAGFDESSPLVRNDGKPTVCRQLLSGGEPAALVGDGVTDLEAGSVGIFVIGFGGIARRERIARSAPAYIDGPSLRPLLELLLTAEERARLVQRQPVDFKQ